MLRNDNDLTSYYEILISLQLLRKCHLILMRNTLIKADVYKLSGRPSYGTPRNSLSTLMHSSQCCDYMYTLLKWQNYTFRDCISKEFPIVTPVNLCTERSTVFIFVLFCFIFINFIFYFNSIGLREKMCADVLKGNCFLLFN
jgi:hypothetical protein